MGISGDSETCEENGTAQQGLKRVRSGKAPGGTTPWRRPELPAIAVGGPRGFQGRVCWQVGRHGWADWGGRAGGLNMADFE